ncbi:hypothetical protein ASPVEDRAFT_123508 [Aspergillus versicolor CBS 583.65]|uniref:Short-chain dehydrogenase n=1 Tax=Aspergillus versicolor CBS 583.65 TaxID=1036611 RepID=A0A1L9PA69_ASPVE|nr:uncharacterized protein ASPVEDRAFT_123508 [Aspergillus versicolor CBS 583.65]OJI98411.1 hypothetical protein ASPVEDRAFT_123508 [Aspergillus versicolor CBS 583.65]
MSLDTLGLFNVKGRVALVTGGSSGIGLMISRGLVSNGAKVYLVALPSDPIAETVRDLNELGRDGGSAEGIACDISSKDAIQHLAATISAKEPALDMLISNAGIRRDPSLPCNVLTAPLAELQASMWSIDSRDWEDTFRVNTTAHYFLSVAFLPLLAAAADRVLDGTEGRKGRDEGRGVVVVTSSCASMHNATNVDLTSYAASKAATDHLVRLLAAKYNRFYVRVVGINPGFVPSNMNPVGAEGNIFSSLFDKVPARRAGNAEDIAGTVLYLVSKAGAYVDGISLCIDGGRILLANGQE